MDGPYAEKKPSPAEAVSKTHVETLRTDKDPDLNDVHIRNELAHKGDSSDGKLDWSIRSQVAAAALAFLYTGSQIMLFFLGGCLTFIQKDLNAGDKSSWLPVANTLAIGAVAPFVGYLQDLLRRRNITLIGSAVILVGVALVGSAHSFAQAVAGMAISGVGAGICELSALAGISDIVPVRYRGYAIGLLNLTTVPIAPYVLYCQLLSTHASWRWGQWICLIWNGLTFIVLAATYFPKMHPRLEGVSKKQTLAKIDYVGGFLSITGITLFLVALQAGGYAHPWTSAYVLAQLIIGLLLIIVWAVWEWKFAKYPMVPRGIFTGQRVAVMSFVLAFISGMDFYSLINFYPISFGTVYDPDPIKIGLKGLGYGITTVLGVCVFNGLLSTKLEAKYVLGTAAAIMTIFSGALVTVTPNTPTAVVALGALAGFGVGGVILPAATVALMVVPDSLLATTAALSVSARTIGGSIGFTIYYNIFLNKIKTALPEMIAEHAISAGLPPNDATAFITTFLTTPADITFAPGFSPEVFQAAVIGSRWAYAYALKYVWYTSIPFGILATICAFSLPNIKKYKTNRVAVAM